MSILFYSPFERRSRDTESLMLAFRNRGHTVISLSQASGTYINEYLKGEGIEAMSYVVSSTPKIWYYVKHILFLIRLCRNRNIDIVFSHLESANFVASLAQFFIRGKVY